MRLFLAIDLPAASKKLLNQQLGGLKKEYPQFSWVPQENFHITLHFFGETNKIDVIKKKIEEAIYDLNSFQLYSLGADLFLKQKIVLYIYFRREKKAEELASRINNIFQIKDKKKFIPHLTFGRSRVLSKQQYLNLKKKLHQIEIEINFSINNIYLFQSIIIPKKSIYKKIATFPLPKQLRF